MSWSDFYLICFLVGFGLSALALLAGTVHLHMPHLHLHHGIHMPRGASGGARRAAVVQFRHLAAFLAWFGGTGFLLERYYHVWVVIAILVATLSGLGAAAVVFWFLAKVLMADEQPLDPGRLRHGRRAGPHHHSHPPRRHRRAGLLRRAARATWPARAAKTAHAIAKGAKSSSRATRKGIAYVRRWEDLARERKPQRHG